MTEMTLTTPIFKDDAVFCRTYTSSDDLGLAVEDFDPQVGATLEEDRLKHAVQL